MIDLRSTLLLLCGLFAVKSPALALLASDQLAQYGRQSWHTENGLPQNTVTAIQQTSDGLLWVGTQAGLARFDGFSFYVLPELQNRAVSSLWINNGALAVSTANTVLELHRGVFVASTARSPRRDSLSGDDPFHATVTLSDKHGVAWLGTRNGLFRFHSGTLDKFGANDPLSNAEILALFEDSEGNIWVGTGDSGLQLIKDQRFATYTTDRVRSVFGNAAQTWLGTDGNGLIVFEKDRTTAVRGLSSDVILSLASNGRNLLVGTPDGLNFIGDKNFTLSSADGLPDDFVRSLFIDSDHSIWAGTRRGLAHIVGREIATFTQSNGLGSDLVGAVTRDRAGTLWVGTLHGLSRWNNGSFTNYTIADGLSSNVITDLHADNEGYLWIATQGGGLNRLRDEMFTHTFPESGTPETIYGVTDDQHGNLWLAAANGIYRLRKKDFDRHPVYTSFGTSDGLRIADSDGGGHPAVWRAPSGGIWFATTRGAAYLSPEHASFQDPAPNIVVESVTVNDRSLSPDAPAEIQPGQARIALQYAGISFNNPQRLRYRYQLVGFDTNWVDAGSRRTAFYTNLGPGQYSFAVHVITSAAPSSFRSATFSFRVVPFFYQTWWFRALLACCSILLIFAIIRWRIRRVKSEFRAVLSERTRIAREIHDTLAQGFAGISVQLELVSRLLASPEKARSHLDQARMLARSCLDDARRTIWDLRMQKTDVEDLPARLSRLVREAAQSSGIPIQFQVRGTYRPLEQRVENEVARIAQEAIANAVRHSRARAIDTNLVFENNTFRLTVSDDGCGMETTTSPPGHFGLTGMRERAAAVGADLSIVSQEGVGTTITLEAPAH